MKSAKDSNQELTDRLLTSLIKGRVSVSPVSKSALDYPSQDRQPVEIQGFFCVQNADNLDFAVEGFGYEL